MDYPVDGLGPYRTMVAVGDSFTEGLGDPYLCRESQHSTEGMCDEVLPGGEFRGWADRVAERLAAEAGGGGFRYANLAVRGKLIGQIVDEQVDHAAGLGGELVTLAGGLNDVLRPGCDAAAVCAALGAAAEKLAAGARLLVLFHSTDPSRRMAGSRRLLPAILHLKQFVSELGERPGIAVVELFDARCFDDPRLWADDRLHLSAEGHRRVAEAVLQAAGFPASFDWRAPLPASAPPGPLRRLAADLRWLGRHVGPWIMRRLRGTSSGDGRSPKRPELTPYP